MLFFDEADALFGRRMQVNDAHDRFANIEVDYLLQRMEQFDGIAVLATNRKGDIDTAFMRRLRFVIDFAPPTVSERERLWRLALEGSRDADGRPLTEPLDWPTLARELDLTGAGIKADALAAAFLARDRGQPDRRAPHLRRRPARARKAGRDRAPAPARARPRRDRGRRDRGPGSRQRPARASVGRRDRTDVQRRFALMPNDQPGVASGMAGMETAQDGMGGGRVEIDRISLRVTGMDPIDARALARAVAAGLAPDAVTGTRRGLARAAAS